MTYSSTSSQRSTVSIVNLFIPSPAISNGNAGKVAHLRIPGNTMIILNSAQAATDLLDKRSAIYSDRAHSDVLTLCAILFDISLLESSQINLNLPRPM